MALQLSDGTDQSVLDLFTVPGGYHPGYVRIRRYDLDREYRNVTMVLTLHADEKTRHDDADGGHVIEWGTTLPESAFEAMKTQDDLDVLYSYLECGVQAQVLIEELEEREAAGETVSDEDRTQLQSRMAVIYEQKGIEAP